MLCAISFEKRDCWGENCIRRYFYDFTWRRRSRRQLHWCQLKHISIHSVIRRCIKLLLNYGILQMILTLVLFYLNLIYFMIKKTRCCCPATVGKMRSLASAVAWNCAVTLLATHRNSNWNKSVKRKDQHRFHSEMTQKSPAISVFESCSFRAIPHQRDL